MKLSNEEKIRLDGNFTLEELDTALKTSNKRSAPGIDGVNNKLIEKLWQFVRKPLLRYAECCFRKGSLTNSFRTACIKIIPKKGDLGLSKNWRPILLLTCYYKLISRVIIQILRIGRTFYRNDEHPRNQLCSSCNFRGRQPL